MGATDRMSPAELLLPQHLAELDIFVTREVRVCEDRRFRFDFAERQTPKRRPRLAFEIDGGSWTNGRHTRGAGFERDLEKMNTALIEGFAVFRFTPQMVLDGRAKDFVRRWLNSINS